MKFQSVVPIAQPVPKCLLSPHQVKGFVTRIQSGQSSAGLGDAVEVADSGLSCSEEIQARASFVGTPLFPRLWRPRQGDLCEFAASLAYRVWRWPVSFAFISLAAVFNTVHWGFCLLFGWFFL